MDESNKSLHSMARNGELLDLVIGRAIDIGSGDYPLRIQDRAQLGELDRWDLAQGNAELMEGVADETYDAVFSSHCLEHMASVPTALHNWARILKPGGAMVILVPDFMLYERWCWPSRYNPDHKAAFTLFDVDLPAPVGAHGPIPFYRFREMLHLGRVNNLTLTDARLTSDKYDLAKVYDLSLDQTRGAALAQVTFVYRKGE